MTDKEIMDQYYAAMRKAHTKYHVLEDRKLLGKALAMARKGATK